MSQIDDSQKALTFFAKVSYRKLGDNLHELSKVTFWKTNLEKYFKMLSAENFIQQVEH